MDQSVGTSKQRALSHMRVNTCLYVSQLLWSAKFRGQRVSAMFQCLEQVLCYMMHGHCK